MTKITTLILMLGIATTTIAQTPTQFTESFYHIRVGLQAGPVFSSLQGNFAQDYKSTLNGFAGFSFEYRFNETVSFVANANYDRKSFREDYQNPYYSGPYVLPSYTEKLLFQYLNVPLMVRAYIDPDKQLYTNVGVSINYLIDMSNKLESEGYNDGSAPLQFESLFNKTEFGVTLGLGYNFEVSTTANLSVELRDDYGLSDIMKPGNKSNADFNTARFIVGYSFNCAKENKKIDF
jgi:opacity protein-like surface antigen